MAQTRELPVSADWMAERLGSLDGVIDEIEMSQICLQELCQETGNVLLTDVRVLELEDKPHPSQEIDDRHTSLAPTLKQI